MNVDNLKISLIIESEEYKKIVLRFYIIDYPLLNNIQIESGPYIKKENLKRIYDIFFKQKMLLSNSLEKYTLLEENIVFDNRLYKFINMKKLIQFIKIIQPCEIKYNTIIHLIENAKSHNIYPKTKRIQDSLINEIDKLKIELKELKKIKNDILDIKIIIEYINNKINKIETKYKPHKDLLAGVLHYQKKNKSENKSYSIFYPKP